MVKVIGVGRLTRDPEVTYSKKNNGEQLAVARFTLAVKRPFAKEGAAQDTDFLPCVVFGKAAETAEKHLSKGAKVAFEGRPQSSSYKDKDGKDQFSISFLIENWEFDESKAEAEARKNNRNQQGGNYQQGNGNQQGGNYQQGNGNPQGGNYQQGNGNPQGGNYQQGNGNPQGGNYQQGNGNPQGGSNTMFSAENMGFGPAFH